MKTIEERAYSRYAENGCPHDCEKCDLRTDCTDVDYVWAFIAGAQSEHEELTRWHDPKEELPDTNLQVLVRVESRDGEWWHIALAHVRKGKLVVEGNMIEKGDMIVGWREIHE